MGIWSGIAKLLGIENKKLLEAGEQGTGEKSKTCFENPLFRRRMKVQTRKSFTDLFVDALIAKGAKKEMLSNPKILDDLRGNLVDRIVGRFNDGSLRSYSKELVEEQIGELLETFPEYDLLGRKDASQVGLKIDPETGYITYRKLNSVGAIEESIYSVDDNGDGIIEMNLFVASRKNAIVADGRCEKKCYGNKSKYDEYGIVWERVFEEYKNGTTKARIRWERDKKVFWVVKQTLEINGMGNVDDGNTRCSNTILKDHCGHIGTIAKVLNRGHIDNITGYLDIALDGHYCNGTPMATVFAARSYCNEHPDELIEILESSLSKALGSDTKLAKVQFDGIKKYAEQCGIVFGENVR